MTTYEFIGKSKAGYRLLQSLLAGAKTSGNPAYPGGHADRLDTILEDVGFTGVWKSPYDYRSPSYVSFSGFTGASRSKITRASRAIAEMRKSNRGQVLADLGYTVTGARID